MRQAFARLQVVGIEVGERMLPGILAALEDNMPAIEDMLAGLGDLGVALIDLAVAAEPATNLFTEGLAYGARGLTLAGTDRQRRRAT